MGKVVPLSTLPYKRPDSALPADKVRFILTERGEQLLTDQTFEANLERCKSLGHTHCLCSVCVRHCYPRSA